MGDYSVPEEIRKLKPRGTNVKKIKGQYYVYSHSQSKDPVTGKWKTNPGKLLGKIVPGVGYCPKELASSEGKITCFNYGEYLLACSLSKCDFVLLKKVFNPDEAMKLFATAAMFALEGYVGLNSAAEKFERTLISRDYPALQYSTYTLTKLLENIGRQSKAMDFQSIALENAKTLAIDGHVIASDSQKNDLSYSGYKASTIKSEQMNLMVALDVDAKMPVATKVFPGYMLDKMDFLDFIRDFSTMKDRIFLMDSGFYTSENMKYIVHNGGNYIIPVTSNRTAYKNAVKPKKGRLAHFLYHAGRKTDTVEYREIEEDGKRIIYYCNVTEKEKLLQSYVSNIDEGKKGFTEAGLETIQKEFGIIVLETSLKDDAKDIYELYKRRWSIETYYDRLKNGLDFEELNLSDYATIQGLAFVMMLAGRIDSRILQAAKKVNMSRKNLVRVMSGLKLVDDGNSAHIHNFKKEHAVIREILGLSYDLNLKCLD